jgi:hypothetical protein
MTEAPYGVMLKPTQQRPTAPTFTSRGGALMVRQLTEEGLFNEPSGEKYRKWYEREVKVPFRQLKPGFAQQNDQGLEFDAMNGSRAGGALIGMLPVH